LPGLGERLLLQGEQLGRALAGQGEQSLVVVGREGLAFGGALDLDEVTVVGEHEVEIHVGGGILRIGQIQTRLALDDAQIEAREVDGLVTARIGESANFMPATVAEYCGFAVNFAELVDLEALWTPLNFSGRLAYVVAFVLVALFTITAILAGLVTTKASAALMFPIAASAAEAQGIGLVPISYMIMIAAATAFATPIGFQTNLMVYGPGGYKYVDFLRLGLPLQTLVGISTVTVIALLWL